LGEDTYSFDYLVWMNSNSYLYFRIASSYVEWTDGTTSSIMGDNSLPWIHVAIVRTGDDVELFLNSASMGTQSGVGAINDTRFDTIGAKSGGVQYANAKFDSVSCWDSVLDAATISSIYNTGKPNDLTLAASYTGGGGVDKSGDLQGYWRMGEGITNWNGTNWQLPDYSKNTLFSQKSFEFDGVNEFIDCGNDSSLQITGAMTLSCWIKTTESGDAVLMSKDNNTERCWSLWGLNNLTGDFVRFIIWNSGSATVVTSTGTINDGNWHNVVATFEPNSSMKIYIDGVLDITNTTSIPATIDNDAVNVRIAGLGNSAFEMRGSVDSVSIFDSVLDVATILSLYNVGEPNSLLLAASYTTGGGTDKSGDLQAYWKMGDDATWDGSDWTIPDASTNSNDGTSDAMEQIDLKFDSPTNPNAGLSDGMDEVDLKFNTPTNPNAGLSDGMGIESKINNAPDNINQGLSDGMDENAPSGRDTDVPE